MKGFLTSSALFLLLTAVSTAEPSGEKKTGREKGPRHGDFATHFFAKLDANEDAAVSQAEFAANPRLENATPEQREILFKRLDKNGDGLIKRDELKPPKGRPGERPGWLQNGPVNFEQFSQQPRVQRLDEEMRRGLFDRLDQNKDGILDRADIPKERGPRPERRPLGPLPHSKIDTNKDGKISFAEFQSAPFHKGLSEDEAEDRFEELDQDEDGFLSPEERPKGPRRIEGKPRKKDTEN